MNETIQKHSKTIQNTVNTSTHITKPPAHTHTHTLQNKLKQTQYKLHTKSNRHTPNEIVNTPNEIVNTPNETATHQMK
jgi:hypothetical protein